MFVAILVLLIALQVLSVVGSIALIGEPRKPYTSGNAIATFIVGSLVIVFYVALIFKLT